MNRAQLVDAPAGLLPLPRPLMTGEVLDAAFRLFRAGIFRCLPYSGLAVLALQAPAFLQRFAAIEGLGSPLLYGVMLLLCVPLLGGLMLRLQSVATGIRPRFRLELATALRRWPAGILATLGAFVIPVSLLLLGPAFTQGLSGEAVIFLSIPLFWPSALFAVALPAFWCAGLGPFAAIRRSVRLSWRRSWRMVGTLLATVCIVAVFYVLVSILIGIATPLFGRADLFLMATVASLLYLVIGAFGVPFLLATLIVAHQDLELRWQGRGAKP